MTLTRLEISQYLFEHMNLSKNESKKIVSLFFEEIKNMLINGKSVKFYGFGNFYVFYKKQRLGRNPKTGSTILINARKIIKFTPGKKLKKIIEQNLLKKI
ncbi:integration host factor subunit alpha [Buchnera aphidicola (Nipponaphis monzeni)]|uniref:Integration host factor subunit alpha n=1 Tax=Buchnera aphidicola (Nipponaphis monzeni) TaxID=2495405 RepID=A0A455T9Z1_9GAMM|nr:integration host factor subunit alpha [Buchnera aphidicola]BBI01120.1 integration host factor subunit alpha [Buchnera aphidicola (Nipponaphis monzeni)]